MTSPRRASGGGASGAPNPTVVKGAVLILVAVVLGLFLLSQGFDDESGSIDAGDDASADDGGSDNGDEATTDATTGATTTTEPRTVRAPNQVTVIVANGSGVPGAAGRVSDQLKSKGYITTEPANTNGPVATTVVYYVGEDKLEADEVAKALGIDLATNSAAVAAMPNPSPVPDLCGATILVNLGPDLAPKG